MIVLPGLAEVLLRIGDTDGADQYASRALRLNPDGAATQLTMARVFEALDADRSALIRHRYLCGYRQRIELRLVEPGEICAADLPLL